MITIKCESLEKTNRLAEIISGLVFEGFLILANGDLGAGKTSFAKCLASHLGVNATVTSPTFNILKCYRGKEFEFYHIDAYRLEGMKQDLGLEEFIEGDGVCFVEWGQYLDYLLPDQYLTMNITIKEDEARYIEIKGEGNRYESIEKEIERLW